MTDHSRHYSVWRVEVRPAEPGHHRQALLSRTRFKAIPPTDPTDPGGRESMRMFDTFGEAMNFAQREAFKQRLKDDFDQYLDDNQNVTMSQAYDHTGLDTMYRTFKWWGRYDLAHFLENI